MLLNKPFHFLSLLSWVRRVLSAVCTSSYLTEQSLKRDPLEDWLTQLVDDAVCESCREVVRTCVMDMAQEHLDDQFVLDIYSDVVIDHIQEIGDELVSI